VQTNRRDREAAPGSYRFRFVRVVVAAASAWSSSPIGAVTTNSARSGWPRCVNWPRDSSLRDDRDEADRAVVSTLRALHPYLRVLEPLACEDALQARLESRNLRFIAVGDYEREIVTR
jgi:hypothetical protein